MESAPSISFIIPVYNGLELTRTCLRTLTESLTGSDHEIILVDDGSTDGTRAFLSSIDRSDVRIVCNEKNLGFAGANNAAARIARGEFLCLINNDLVFTPSWLEPMIRALRTDPSIGIVGNIQRSVATGAIDHAGIFIGLDGKPHHRRKRALVQHWKTLTAMPAVTGACMMLRRSDFADCGGFDPQFVNGAEDVDLCFQIAAKGRRIVVANRSVIDHHVSASRGSSTRDEENCRKLFAKWPEELSRLGARYWPGYYLDRILRGRTRFKPNLIFSALIRACRLNRSPSPTGMAVVRHRMALTETHWRVQLGSGFEGGKPSLLRDFQYDGFISSSIAGASWLRETARVTLPAGILVRDMVVRGAILPELKTDRPAKGRIGLRLCINGASVRRWWSLPEGPFVCEMDAEPTAEDGPSVLDLQLMGTGWTNALAYIGRKTAKWPMPKILHQTLQDYRPQRRNQRLQITRIGVNGEDLLDFSRPNSPFVFEFAQRYSQLGINLVGWFAGELGIGESVRCATRAVDAVGIPRALVNCRLNCLAAQGDWTYLAQLQEDNPYPINLFHIDAPQSADIDHEHSPAFRENHYNIGYWAWELPEFPDGWVRYFRYFDEIWTPSRFTTEAIQRKSPLPVLTMPHAIDFPRPEPGARDRMHLPADRFLFLSMYDLNSYQERKNPRAVIKAYARAFKPDDQAVGLVIKVHGLDRNVEAYAELKDAVSGLPGIHLISETLPRSSIYDLLDACDCFVSLHRSEGFGLGVAEAMFLEKPVISTDWSATAEFVNAGNGCPVRVNLIELERTIGPYGKGQIWADPDVDHAAEQMQKVAGDSLFCRQTGYNARQTILKMFAPKTIGGLYEQRLRAITLW